MSSSRRTAGVRRRLELAGCVAADEEAEELVAPAPDDDTLESWVRQRESGVPLAWIIGSVRFCGKLLRVDRQVYVPRPQSEELAYRAGVFFAGRDSPRRAIDLCTGCGAVAVWLASVAPGTVLGVDLDARAVACARGNGVMAVRADLAEPITSRCFDVVTAVAPYVPTEELAFLPSDVRRYEPRLALDGGLDGLGLVRRVVESAARLLTQGGGLFLEVGGDQDQALIQTMNDSGFGPMDRWFDEEGDLRGISAELAEDRS